jgi:hypothetical protein
MLYFKVSAKSTFHAETTSLLCIFGLKMHFFRVIWAQNRF